MKKLLVLMIVLTIVFSMFVACTKNEENKTDANNKNAEKNNNQQDSEDENQNDKDNDSEENPYKEKINISINIIDTDKQNNDIRYDFLKEKFNVDFEMVACSLNDVKEKVRIWVASGDMPDVLWSEINNPGELKTWAQNGALKALPDLSGYSDLVNMLDEIQTDDVLKVDGKKYFIPTARDLASVNFISNQMIIYRKDWAKDLGMYKDSYTWEEMMTLAKEMVSKDPGNNGEGKTIGMTSVKWAYPACTGIQQVSPYWSTFLKKDGKYVWGAEQEETKEALKLAKRMYEEGVIWSEQALAQNADGPAKFGAGQVGLLYHNLTTNNVTKIINGLKETYPDKDPLDLIEIMKVKSPDGTYFGLQTTDTWGSMCFSADSDDKMIERFLAICNYLASKEGIRLQRFGVLGKDYEMDGDEIKMLWDVDEGGNYISPYAINSDRLLSIIYLNEYEKAFTKLVDSKVRTIMEQIKDYQTDENINPLLVNYELDAFSAPNKDKSTLGGDLKDKMIELIIASDDIETDYNDWLDSQKDKKNAVLKELKELND